MTKQDLLHLIDGREGGSGLLFHRVCARLAAADPELTSLFWLLREGVIGPRQFRGRLKCTAATAAPGPNPARRRVTGGALHSRG